MLEVKHLSITNQPSGELVDINFQIRSNELVFLVGANGSGKSALLRAIAEPDTQMTGEIVINHFASQKEPDKAKSQIGYLANPVKLEPYLTGYEYLELVGSFFQLSPKVRGERILKLAATLNCREHLYTVLERLGPAFHQKAGLMATLLHQPPILLWDEPLLHLDYFAATAVQKLLKEATSHANIGVIATNDLQLAEELADRIIILDRGQVVADGNLTELSHQFNTTKQLAKIFEKSTTAHES